MRAQGAMCCRQTSEAVDGRGAIMRVGRPAPRVVEVLVGVWLSAVGGEAPPGRASAGVRRCIMGCGVWCGKDARHSSWHPHGLCHCNGFTLLHEEISDLCLMLLGAGEPRTPDCDILGLRAPRSAWPA